MDTYNLFWEWPDVQIKILNTQSQEATVGQVLVASRLTNLKGKKNIPKRVQEATAGQVLYSIHSKNIVADKNMDLKFIQHWVVDPTLFGKKIQKPKKTNYKATNRGVGNPKKILVD